MPGAPGAERLGALVSRIDEDEDGALGVQGDRQLHREVTPGVAGRSPVDPDGQDPALDAERLERADLLRLGREPRESGVLEHVVEREQAAEQHFLRSVPAVADVLGAERAVDPASEDPAHLPALELLLGGEPPLEQGPDEPKGLPAIDPEPGGELGAGEHAAVEARQRDPLGLAPRPAEGLERVSRPGEMGDHLGCSVTRARSACR